MAARCKGGPALAATTVRSSIKGEGYKLASSLSQPLTICISRVAPDPFTGATNGRDSDAAPLANSALVPEVDA